MFRLSTFAAVVSLALFGPTARPATAGDTPNETAEVTFAFVFPVDPWADVDQDGVPDPAPIADPLDLLNDELHVIVVGTQENVSDSLVFKDTQQPMLCGTCELSGTTWSGDSYARIVQQGRSAEHFLYVAPGNRRPAYRSAILPSDVIDAAACWIKIDAGTGHWVVQDEYDLDTGGAVVIVTAVVRVE
jgi:hypothetical protein